MRIEDLLIEENETVLGALKQLDTTGHKVLFIAPDGRLKGVVTDGDVRRHLLAGGSLQDNVSAMQTERLLISSLPAVLISTFPPKCVCLS